MAFTIKEAMMDMLMNKHKDADATFVVHGTEIKAHRCILSARSDVLKAMLNFHYQPADGRHRIDDPFVSPDVFKEFIKFLYSDRCDVNYENLGPMMHLSEMYDVELVKPHCVAFVRIKCGTIAGVIRCGEVAVQFKHECQDLLSYVFESIGQNFSYHFSFWYTTDEGTAKLASKELVQIIVKDCPRTERFNNETLFDQVYNWGKKLCKNENGTIKALVDLVSEVFSYKFSRQYIQTTVGKKYRIDNLVQRLRGPDV